MAPKIRALVVDDSSVFRGFWGRLLAAQNDIEVVTTSVNGEDALAAVKAREIDVVILDVEMPIMDGLTAIPLILAARPAVKIIMASSFTLDSSRMTIDALARGAHDFLAKPTSLSAGGDVDSIQRDLLAKIRSLVKVSLGAELASPGARDRRPAVQPSQSLSVLKKPEIIVIGASTGGPNALSALMSAMGTKLKAPVLITQHMPRNFTTMLAERLAKDSGRPCLEAKRGDVVEEGKTYVAPGDFHMTVRKDGHQFVLDLNQEAPENFCRPAVDVMFRSVAKAYGSAALGLILTGMGEDGRRGAANLREAGASVIAQDEASSVVWGMPGAVVRAGLAQEVLPLDKMPERLLRLYI